MQAYAFVLAVADFDATAAYFHDALGFALDWADATDWRLARRDGVRVMIGRCPGVMPASATGDHSYFGYVEVADVDVLHTELAGRGAIILRPPFDQPYRMREMVVGTPDGHRMVFAHGLGEPPPTAAPPPPPQAGEGL